MMVRFAAIKVDYDKRHPFFSEPFEGSTRGNQIDQLFQGIHYSLPGEEFVLKLYTPRGDSDKLLMTLKDQDKRSPKYFHWNRPFKSLWKDSYLLSGNFATEVLYSARDLVNQKLKRPRTTRTINIPFKPMHNRPMADVTA